MARQKNTLMIHPARRRLAPYLWNKNRNKKRTTHEARTSKSIVNLDRLTGEIVNASEWIPLVASQPSAFRRSCSDSAATTMFPGSLTTSILAVRPWNDPVLLLLLMLLLLLLLLLLFVLSSSLSAASTSASSPKTIADTIFSKVMSRADALRVSVFVTPRPLPL